MPWVSVPTFNQIGVILLTFNIKIAIDLVLLIDVDLHNLILVQGTMDWQT